MCDRHLDALLRSKLYQVLACLAKNSSVPTRTLVVSAQDESLELQLIVSPKRWAPSGAVPDGRQGASPDVPDARPREIHDNILQALRRGPLTGPQIAERAGYAYTSYLRSVLAEMCRGPTPLLKRTGAGYEAL